MSNNHNNEENEIIFKDDSELNNMNIDEADTETDIKNTSSETNSSSKNNTGTDKEEQTTDTPESEKNNKADEENNNNDSIPAEPSPYEE